MVRHVSSTRPGYRGKFYAVSEERLPATTAIRDTRSTGTTSEIGTVKFSRFDTIGRDSARAHPHIHTHIKTAKGSKVRVDSASFSTMVLNQYYQVPSTKLVYTLFPNHFEFAQRFERRKVYHETWCSSKKRTEITWKSTTQKPKYSEVIYSIAIFVRVNSIL